MIAIQILSQKHIGVSKFLWAILSTNAQILCPFTGGQEWDEFLHKYMEKWKARIKNWVLDSIDHHQVHVVRYEDLKQHISDEMAKMLSFLKIPFSEKELPTRLHDDFTTFKRKHNTDIFEHYSNSQKAHIRTVLLDTIQLAKESNLTRVLRLEEYIP